MMIGIRRWLTVMMVIVAMSGAVTSIAQTVENPRKPDNKLVLVLSGGGARGAAHIGVLRVLEELHIAPDLIVGTSMGSIVGGLYSAGWSPDEMEDLLASLDWNEVFSDEIQRRHKTFRRKQDDRPILINARVHFAKWKPHVPPGLLGGQSLELLMDAIQAQSFVAADLDELNIPYRAVAADLATGQPVVLVDTTLATAMRASMSIPGAFTPVVLDGRTLVDGGAVANLPIGIAKDLGATSVIAVDISSPLSGDEGSLADFISIMGQLNSLLTVGNRDRDLALLTENDALIQPDLGDISFISFDRAREAVAIGEKTARAMSDQLRRYAVDEHHWDEFLERQRRRYRGPITIDEVDLENTAPISDAIVRRALNIRPPAAFEPSELVERLRQLHALRTFGIIEFELEGEGEHRDLVVKTPSRDVGRGSIQLGLGFSDDFNGNTGYTVAVRHQVLPVNRRGGEWQNVIQLGTVNLFESQFYQPLDSAMWWFVEPSIGVRRDIVNLWAAGIPVVQYEIEGLETRIAAGRVLGRWGEFRSTAYTGDYRALPRIGSPIFPPDEERRGGFKLEVAVDTVEHVAFPRHGTEATARYERSSEALGAENDTDLASVRFAHSFTFGDNTFTPYVEYGENFESTLDYLNLFKLGGLGRLSGLGDDELLGEKVVLARLLAYRRLTGFRWAGFRFRLFAGVSLEAGNVYNRYEPITTSSLTTAWGVFVGADTPLGPWYFGYGRAQDRGRFYLLIGDRF